MQGSSPTAGGVDFGSPPIAHIAQPTVRYCAQAHGTESETSIGLEENLGFCFSMCHKSRFEFERYSSAATVAARFPHSAGVHWRIASNSRVPGSCSSGIAHRAPLCALRRQPAPAQQGRAINRDLTWYHKECSMNDHAAS
jgi:hypothetical protein